MTTLSLMAAFYLHMLRDYGVVLWVLYLVIMEAFHLIRAFDGFFTPRLAQQLTS